MKRLRLFAVLLVVWVACRSGAAHHQPMPDPEGLVVVAGATDVERKAGFDGVLRYVVREPYPATQALDVIDTTLKTFKWTPMQMDLLNPELQSSHVRGWTEHLDGDQRVFQWMAAWTNERGDVVQYTLRYRVSGEAKPTGQDATAEVEAVRLTPKALAEFRKQLREAERKVKELNAPK